jgi:hypothetical protein
MLRDLPRGLARRRSDLSVYPGAVPGNPVLGLREILGVGGTIATVTGTGPRSVPTQSEGAISSLAWIESARAPAIDTGQRVAAGVDVAGPGKDETVVTVRCGGRHFGAGLLGRCRSPRSLVQFLNKWRSRLEAVNVDAIGVGYNFGLYLRDLKFPVQLINVGESSSKPERFLNLRPSGSGPCASAFRRVRSRACATNPLSLNSR